MLIWKIMTMYATMARHGATHTHTNVIPALTWEAKAGESGAQDWPRLQRMDEHVYL